MSARASAAIAPARRLTTALLGVAFTVLAFSAGCDDEPGEGALDVANDSGIDAVVDTSPDTAAGDLTTDASVADITADAGTDSTADGASPDAEQDQVSTDVGERCFAVTCGVGGTCDDSTGSVICTCDPGYTGDFCDACDTGYHEDPSGTCVVDESCLVMDPCGANGTCVEVAGEVQCECDTAYAGDLCDACAPGHHDDGAGCVLDEQCLMNTCGVGGSCSIVGGTVSCQCDPGYTGTFCEACDTGYHATTGGLCEADVACPMAGACSGNGACTDDTGLPVCACDAGYAGADCDQCDAGYHDENGVCVPDEQCLASTCGPGTCSVAGGIVSCVCPGEYAGVFCENCASGYHRDALSGLCVANETCTPMLCGGRGTCDDSSGVTVCTCDDGYSGTTCDQCSAGYEVNLVTGGCEIPCVEGWSWIRCNGVCIDGRSDENCGGCGVDCGDGSCDSGTMVCECEGRMEDCNGECADPFLNEDHCGACGQSCGADELCFGGTCTGSDPTCGGCADNELCCSGACVDFDTLMEDPANCGSCGTVCDTAGGEICAGGTCFTPGTTCTGCSIQQICCDDGGSGVCVNPWTMRGNQSHCGGCNIACPANESCWFGVCQCRGERCDDGNGGTICVETMGTDDNNCGGCGVACTNGDVCLFGQCISSTAASCDPSSCELCCTNTSTGADDCLSDRWDLGDSTEHCGGCGIECAPGEECDDGTCICPFYWDDTDYALCGGVCTLVTSESQCGDCDTSCTGAETCDYDPMNGWNLGCLCAPEDTCPGGCVDTETDPQNCGGCGVVCGAGTSCETGGCCLDDGQGHSDPATCCNGDLDNNGVCGDQSPLCAGVAGGSCTAGADVCCEGVCNVGSGTCCFVDGSSEADETLCCNGDPEGNNGCGDQTGCSAGIGNACSMTSECCMGICADVGGTDECCLPDGSRSEGWGVGACCNGDMDGNGFCGYQRLQ